MQPTAKLIHFDGDWTPQERRATEQAIRFREPHLQIDVPSSCMIAPWVCAKQKSPLGTRYLARRVNLDRAFEGRTVSELCKTLQRPRLGIES